MKRLISLFLIFSLCSNLVFASPLMIPQLKAASESRLAALDFKDMVPKAHWSFEALANAVDTGIMQGASGMLRPNDKMTRAELVTTIINASGLGNLNPQDLMSFRGDLNNFSDIAPADWFYNQIAMAYKLKLIDGFSSTKISPQSAVTREQVFTILSRFMSLDLKNVDDSILNHFKDTTSVSTWAKPSVAAMVNAGYVSGTNGYLKPGDAITREEFAQLMYNLFKNNYVKDERSASALKNKTIEGNLIVSSADVSLENINVTGDVIIADGVGNGNITLDHVAIKGRLVIRGGGEHSIYLKSTTAHTIVMNKLSDGGVRLYADEGSVVSYIEIPDGKDTVIIDCSIENLVISNDNLNVTINQTVKNLSVSGDNVLITGKGTIDTLILDKGVRKISVVASYMNVLNHSGNTISVVNQDGKTLSVPSDIAYVVNVSKEPENSRPSVMRYAVNLHANGGTAPESMLFNEGASLGGLPVPQKENAIFLGWFTDDGSFENAVANETNVTSNMDVYAAYIDSEVMEESNEQTTTSVMDVPTTYVVYVRSEDPTMSAGDVEADITGETITEEPSEFVGFTVTGSGGAYAISATSDNGYSTGSSYSIVLNNEALSFQGENRSIRTFNFSVIMAEPVLNLQLNSALGYIPASDINTVTQNGEAVTSIFAPLYAVGESAPVEELYGTFNYLGSEDLKVGDTVAIYEGTSPDQRVVNVDYSDQPISYVNITAKNGTTISYGSSDPSEIIFTPDVLPVNEADDQDGDPNNHSIRIDVSKMTYDSVDFAEMGLSLSTTVDSGDFIAFYTSSPLGDEISTYAKISDVATVGEFYIISYGDVDIADVYSSMDMVASSDISYEEIVSNVGIEEMELAVQQQVEESGFAESASAFLVALSQMDEETRDQVTKDLGIENFSISQSVSSEMNRSAGAGISSFGSGPDIDVKVKISQALAHFSGKGLRAQVVVTTTFELGDDMSLSISGTFVEEIKVKMNIESKTIWKKKGIFPYIADYKVSAAIDLYNYTYLGIDMNLTSVSNEGWSDEFDVTDSIEKLKTMTSSIDANDKVREFYELYQDMMAQEHDYIELFDVNIGDFSGSIDPFHILAYGFTIDFVVSLDANVALGSEFSYEKATRYSFSLRLKDQSTTSSQTDLMDEQYNFNVYAMGELGVRAGIKFTLKVGFVDVKLNSVGIATEVGAYWKIWGFVNYKLNYVNNKTTSKSSGACYMEIGIYLSTSFNAQVGDGKIEYNKELYSNTWPLWNTGNQYYVYDFKYTLNDSNDDILLKGDESEYALPTSVFKMLQMDFKSGDVATKTRSSSDFKYTIKDDPNHVFAVSNSGVINVTPPERSDIAKATIEITWNKTPLSFTSVPISRTFELKWDNLADSYIINFDSNEGSNESSINGAYNSNLVLPTPTREGYVFNGWYSDNGTFAQAFTQNKMPASNYKLYAKWTAGSAKYTTRHYQEEVDGSYVLANTDTSTATTHTNVTPAVRSYTGFITPSIRSAVVAGDGSTVVEYYYARDNYTVTFKLNNGSSDMVNSLKYGSKIVAPSLVKSGYTFTGWNATVAETMPAQNLTYTAVWSLDTYTITYSLDGGSVSNPSSFDVTTNITLVNPTKAGFVFTGWTGTGITSAAKLVTIQSGTTGNRYYTATWKSANDTRYSVYHKKQDLAGNYVIYELEALKGIAGNSTAIVAKAYTGFTAEPFSQALISGDETTIIEVNYTRNSYVLTFDADGGLGGTSGNVKYGAIISAPTVTKAGYTFNGWSAEVASTMPASGLSYTAQWIMNGNTSYIVNHNLQDLENASSYTLAETENLSGRIGTAITPNVKTYVGFTAPSTQTTTIAADGSTVVQYNYTRNSYVLTFDADGGLGGTSGSVKYGETISAPTVTKAGYTLNGWSAEVASTMPASDLSYTAQWTVNGNTSYIVNHNLQDVVNDSSYNLAETESLSGTIGINITPNVKTYVGFTPPSTQTTTIAADGSTVVQYNYTRNSYVLTFDVDGGVGGTSGNVKYEEAISAPTVTKIGYTFNGWSAVVASTMPASDVSYTAQWALRIIPLGSGTSGDPFLIENINDLKWISQNNAANSGFSGTYFKQIIDIDMSSTRSVPWTAIGDITNKFNGAYDGNGYSVENLYISQATVRQGLFGVIGVSGSVMDLGVTDVDITCTDTATTTGALAGALVGLLYGNVSRCYSTGTVTGDGNTGGLVGYAYGGSGATIKDSYSTCTVVGNGSLTAGWQQLGGLLGKLSSTGAGGLKGSISNSYATGNVTAAKHANVGGLTGEIDTAQEVYSVFSTGTPTGSTYVGGIIGLLQGPMYNGYTTIGVSNVGAGGSVTGGGENVAISWFKTLINFTTASNWHVTHQWNFDATWAIDSAKNNGLPYLQKSKLGR